MQTIVPRYRWSIISIINYLTFDYNSLIKLSPTSLLFLLRFLGYPTPFAHVTKFRGASLVAQTVKNLPVNAGDLVQSLSWKDPLKEGMATHSSVFAWETPWTEKPGGVQFLGSQRVRYN